MARVIEAGLMMHQFWNNYAINCQKRGSLDNLTIIKIMDSYCLLTSDYNFSKIHYFDLEQDKIFDINENEILSFIDHRAVLQNREVGLQEHVEIILNILCKKTKLTCISDLKIKKFDRNLLKFVDKEKYKEEYQYIIHYVDSK